MSYRNNPAWVKINDLYRDLDTDSDIKLSLATVLFSIEAQHRDYPEEDFSKPFDTSFMSWYEPRPMVRDVPRNCAGCGEPMEIGTNANRLYCTSACGKRARRRQGGVDITVDDDEPIYGHSHIDGLA